jgi:hypothetical protein
LWCDRIEGWFGKARLILCVQATTDKAEIIRLLEGLLKLQSYHSPGALPPTLQEGLRGVLPALLSGYGASCSPTDRATLRLLLLANSCTLEEGNAASSVEDPAVLHISSLFSGPLAKAG